MENRIENIVIVGNGISGWLSALFLDRFLNSEGKICKITLFETEETGMGVEEAAMVDFLKFLYVLGINEYDFIVNCDVTFKLGIKFVNWSGEGKNDIFWHPFPAKWPIVGDFHLIDWWLKKKLKADNYRVNADYYCSINPYLGDAAKAPKKISEDRLYFGETPYSYHFNTNMAIKYFSKIGKQRGIKIIQDNITAVKLNTQGLISQIQTKKSGNFSGDLFIDCTGFSSLLINKNMKEPFVSYVSSLVCDSSIVLRFPLAKDEKKINPFLTATALNSGWFWHIPLYTENSYGYVYSSAHITKEKAEKELLETLGKKAGVGTAKHTKLRVGHSKSFWKKNCVCIGLSAGYVEPLESTTIQMIELGLWGLLFNFPDKTFNPVLMKNYNNFMAVKHQNVRDFTVLHYCLSKRDDTKFWKENKIKIKVPDSLKDDLELFDKVLFDFRTKPSSFSGMFSRESFFYVLAGLKRLPKSSLAILYYKNMDKEVDQVHIGLIKKNPLYTELPDHYQYLSDLHKNHKKILFQP